ncbi:MAG: carboxypeptidase regulatory-like domain-containing protein [Acidimicrobiales bacterium]|nr:carboxypeptidase regulatory-like domain-containing protein [Acidimicrobiales bacterium]
MLFPRPPVALLASMVVVVGVSAGSPAPAMAAGATATITGRVTAEADNQPIAGLYVIISQSDPSDGTAVQTDADGKYELTIPVNPGNYFIYFTEASYNPLYASEWWNDAGRRADATPVPVTAGATTANIDARLAVDRQPDLTVRQGRFGAEVGLGTINSTGQGQTRRASVGRGGSVSYVVSAINTGRVPQSLRLTGTTTTADFRVRYTVGGTDVTRQVTLGEYVTPELEVGYATDLKVTVTARSGSVRGDVAKVRVTARSDAPPNQSDTVKAVTTRT